MVSMVVEQSPLNRNGMGLVLLTYRLLSSGQKGYLGIDPPMCGVSAINAPWFSRRSLCIISTYPFLFGL